MAMLVARQLRINMTVDDQQIDPTVVVVVKELGSPADIGKTNGSYFGRIRDIGKRTATIVMVGRVVVVIEVGYKQVQLAVVLVIAQSHSHASLFPAIFVDCRAGGKSNILESAVTVVVIEKVRH